MKYKIKFLILFVLITTISFAQQVNDRIGHVTLLKKNGEKAKVTSTTRTSDYVGHVTLLRFSQLYLGGGLMMPSSTTKDGANSVNGLDLNVGYYHPIWAWEKSMISLGINAELGYNLGNGERDSKNQYTVYNLAGQSQLPTVSERGDGSPKNAGFRGAAGLQMNVHLGDKFTLSPIINAGYLSTTHKSFLVEETIYPQGNEVIFKLLEQKESKTSGLGILPKLRMTYNITPRIGIWLEGNYTMGPKIKTEVTTFAPEPSAGVDGDYTLSQFEVGSYTTTKRETSYSALGVNGGIVVSLGMVSRGKHTCLICGGKHRGICKKGYAEEKNASDIKKGWNGLNAENLVTKISSTSNDAKKYYNDKAEDCTATSGIECIDEISVSNDFDLSTFDKYVSSEKPERIKATFVNNDMEKFLGSFMNLPNSREIIEALKSGDLTMKKMQAKNNLYTYQLGTPQSIKNNKGTVKIVLSKKHNYVGHVTLLR